MFNYSDSIEAFFNDKVKLSTGFKEKLYSHRKANRDRLISRLPDTLGVTISESNFKPQGSMAMLTIIQTRFADEEYDIDDGIVFNKDDLKDNNGKYLTVQDLREKIRKTLEDKRFCKQPELCTNCVRVFYSEEDEEKHHVDFPIYREYQDNNENQIKELANEKDWIESDPTQVNSWFAEEIKSRNKQKEGKGSQLRILIQLLKRFARSRKEWDLPNGMKLTMLTAECQELYYENIDLAFRKLLELISSRLKQSKVIRNLAHPDIPEITRTNNDVNVSDLKEKIDMALEKMLALDEPKCEKKKARTIWDWVFMSDNFFEDYDKENDDTSKGIASSTPSYPVDHRGGGRFG